MVHPAQYRQQSALAGTGLSHDGYEFSGLYADVHTFQRFDDVIAAGVLLLHILDFNERHNLLVLKCPQGFSRIHLAGMQRGIETRQEAQRQCQCDGTKRHTRIPDQVGILALRHERQREFGAPHACGIPQEAG